MQSVEHDCMEHLSHRYEDIREQMDCEVDCSYEWRTEEWWECRICRATYTDDELVAINEASPSDIG